MYQIGIDGLARLLRIGELVERNGPTSAIEIAAYGSVELNSTQAPLTENGSTQSSALEKEVRGVQDLLRNYAGRLEDVDAAVKNAKEWQIVTRVLDLLFFVIYAVSIVLLLIFLFPKKY